MRPIDADALYERTAEWEASAFAKTEELNRTPLEEMTDEERAEWRRWTAILGERSAFKHDVFDAPTIDVPQQGWIPVTERLPEHFGRYLVTFVPDAGELWTKVEFAMFSDLMGLKKEPIFWNGNVGKSDFENVTKNVTAWMPLPEPWKGEIDATD